MVYTNKDGYGIPRKGHLRWEIKKDKKVLPAIVGKEMIEGVLHYIDNEGKQYVAATFERMWGKVK